METGQRPGNRPSTNGKRYNIMRLLIIINNIVFYNYYYVTNRLNRIGATTSVLIILVTLTAVYRQ